LPHLGGGSASRDPGAKFPNPDPNPDPDPSPTLLTLHLAIQVAAPHQGTPAAFLALHCAAVACSMREPPLRAASLVLGPIGGEPQLQFVTRFRGVVEGFQERASLADVAAGGTTRPAERLAWLPGVAVAEGDMEAAMGVSAGVFDAAMQSLAGVSEEAVATACRTLIAPVLAARGAVEECMLLRDELTARMIA
jgi:hypothetical protein